MMNMALQMITYCAILVVLIIPLGSYMGKVMNGERVFLPRLLLSVENLIYRVLRTNKGKEMGWKKYSVRAAVFNVMNLAMLWIILYSQDLPPLNPQGVGKMSWHLGFNTASSFTTNTNWQAYSGESSLSYFSQMIGLNFQNFVSTAVGVVVLLALIRGFVRVKERGPGNFCTDMTGIVLYILISLLVVVSLAITSQSVPQIFRQYDEIQLVEPVVVKQEGGTAAEVTKGVVPLGPAANQIAIKQPGTSGGDSWGNNSAHSLENPTPLSNLFEMISLLLAPTDLCFTFGRNVKDKRQGVAVFLAMFIMLAAALVIAGCSEQAGTPQIAQDGAVYMGTGGQAGDNMEGKEIRLDMTTFGTWAVFATAASDGSVNPMHDNYTPFGGLVPMLLIQLGEVVLGGTSYGLYGMLGFVILIVFIAGLTVGRTLEYLCKKIEPFEMKMAVLVCLATPAAILVDNGIATLLLFTHDSLNNPGVHGLLEALCMYPSAGSNNGSALAGFNANTPFLDVNIRLIMLFIKFLPIPATLATVGSLAAKKRIAISSDTPPTHNAMFILLLIFVILLVGTLSLFPTLSLGPVAEFFQMIAQGGQ